MKIWTRIKTLWKLSELEITETDKGVHIDYKPNVLGKPHMAMIIKRENAVDKFLKEAKENDNI